MKNEKRKTIQSDKVLVERGNDGVDNFFRSSREHRLIASRTIANRETRIYGRVKRFVMSRSFKDGGQQNDITVDGLAKAYYDRSLTRVL